jgi:hypothetical protein
MPITYTNRKGVTFYLCRGVTKTGKTRYYFARQPKDEPVEEIPAGYLIRESVNGVVSLAKSQPELIEPREVAVVEQAVHRHPKARNYRVNVKRNLIEVYERVGPDADDLIQIFGKNGLGIGMRGRIEQDLEQHSRFEPVLRFILINAQDRTFSVERMGYSGRGGWLDVYASGRIEPLSRRWVPLLGTTALFESIGPE